MLVELSMVEQRYQAVREVLDTGATITDVASRYGVDRRTLHRWLTRYASGVLEALQTQSSKPATSPAQMVPVIEARLVSLRRSHPRWGRARWPRNCAASSTTHRHAPRSTGPSCATNSLSPSSENAPPPVTDDSSARSQWRCGRWTWSVGSTSRTAPSCTA